MAATQLTLTITVDSTQVTDIVNTVSDYLGYQATITNPDGTTSPNPTPRQECIRQAVRDYLKRCYRYGKVKAAVEAAQTSATTSADRTSIT